ncbi:MAG: DMT family transporter [Lachnospiraceae bacterium]|nr:DMT family transporter [Lachnospiraceae bacterium]
MNRLPLKNAVLLFTAALIWGTAFVAQSVGMDYMGPFTFCSVRFLLGAAVLAPFVIIRRRGAAGTAPKGPFPWKAGAVCGTFLFAAASLQQLAIVTTDVGKAGFLTAMYIVIVPLLSFAVTGKTNIRVWAGVVLAACGLWFLSINGSWKLETGDMQLILCALLFAFHIMSIDRFTQGADGVELSFVQFLTAGIWGLLFGIAREGMSMELSAAGLFSIAYCGIMSSGVAYTFQVLGQKGADPAIASLILSLESVISALAGFFILNQSLSPREILGCALMFAAIVIVQLPEKREKQRSLA